MMFVKLRVITNNQERVIYKELNIEYSGKEILEKDWFVKEKGGEPVQICICEDGSIYIDGEQVSELEAHMILEGLNDFEKPNIAKIEKESI